MRYSVSTADSPDLVGLAARTLSHLYLSAKQSAVCDYCGEGWRADTELLKEL